MTTEQQALSAVDVAYQRGYLASRAALKQELLSDEMVEAAVKAMYGYYSPRAQVKITRAKAALKAIVEKL